MSKQKVLVQDMFISQWSFSPVHANQGLTDSPCNHNLSSLSVEKGGTSQFWQKIVDDSCAFSCWRCHIFGCIEIVVLVSTKSGMSCQLVGWCLIFASWCLIFASWCFIFGKGIARKLNPAPPSPWPLWPLTGKSRKVSSWPWYHQRLSSQWTVCHLFNRCSLMMSSS